MDFPKRKQNRLANYNYSQHGCYFITICTKNSLPVLCSIHPGTPLKPPTVSLTGYGITVDEKIRSISFFYPDIKVENYVIMPNLIHLLISLLSGDYPDKTPANQRIPSFISSFKRCTTKAAGIELWHRSYHDHIIRDETDFQARWNYIENNPAKWVLDKYYVAQ